MTMTKNFYAVAVQIQDASNPIAVVGELKEAMIDARTRGRSERKDPAVQAIFFKVYDMLGAPSEREMYASLKKCEALQKPAHPVGEFGTKKKTARRK